MTQVNPAHAVGDDKEQWTAKMFAFWGNQSLCGDIGVKRVYPNEPFAYTYATRQQGACGGELVSGIAGPLDAWAHLLQYNDVYGRIECGSARPPSQYPHRRQGKAYKGHCPPRRDGEARGS